MSFIRNALFTASMAISFLTPAGLAQLEKRNPAFIESPCSYSFTPFVYVGCYSDPSTPRALPFDTGLDSTSMTVQLCTSTCKNAGYRYAGLEYYSECFCGDSVAGAQLPQSSCSFACTGNSSQTCGADDVVSVYMDPTFPSYNGTDISDYSYSGCYAEGNQGRALAYQQNVDFSSMTTESCLAACKSSGYPLAGTEYSGQCFCGVVLGNGTTVAPSTDCNMACNGNSAEICGGPSRLNLYTANDLVSSQPCGFGVQPAPDQSASAASSAVSSTATPASSMNPSASVVSTPVSSSASSVASPSSPAASSIQSSSSSAAPSLFSAASSTLSKLSSSVAPPSSSAAPSILSSSSSMAPATPSAAPSTSSSSSSMAPASPPATPSTSKSSTSSSALSLSSTSSSSAISNSPAPSPSSSSIPTSSSSKISSTAPLSSASSASSIPSSAPVTTSKVSAMSTITSTSSASSCVSTLPVPTCEYGIGNWCSSPLTTWKDGPGCKTAVSQCMLQLASCWSNSGWPSSLKCGNYLGWCATIDFWCGVNCPDGSCTKNDCLNAHPAQGGPATTTSAGLCVASIPATSTATSTTIVPVPTVSSICVLPNGKSGSGYENGNCVGGIPPPVLTCNNMAGGFASSWANYNFKLYNDKDSSKCATYHRDSISTACQDACAAQQQNCLGTYAAGCQAGTFKSDSYGSANAKCHNQYNDCVAINSQTSSGNKCGSFNAGWS